MDKDGLTCPLCGSIRIGVYNSRPGEDCVERNRECRGCGARFATQENVVRIIRIASGDSSKCGRPTNFPSEGHIRVLRVLAGGSRNKAQIAKASGISNTQTIRLIDQLADNSLITCMRAGDLEDLQGQHPLTIIVELTARGIEFLARSQPPNNCDNEVFHT